MNTIEIETSRESVIKIAAIIAWLNKNEGKRFEFEKTLTKKKGRIKISADDVMDLYILGCKTAHVY